MRGIFITFEGGEGSGKSTLITALESALRNEGRSVLVTREPGGTVLADRIRQILLHRDQHGIEKETELLLYMAGRAEHCRKVIAPALAAQKIVLCDRFSDATLAYQGDGRGLDKAWILQLNRWVTDGLFPDLTLLLDCPVEIALARTRKRSASEETRFEEESLAFHQRVRDGYLALAKEAPDRIQILDAEQSPEHLFKDALQRIERVLPHRPS